MSKLERKMGLEETRFGEGAKELLGLVERIKDGVELEEKLKGSRWRSINGFHGVDLITEEGEFFLAVTIEPGWGVAVTSWTAANSRTRPVRIDRRDSNWSVFPKYEVGKNVFDGMRQVGQESTMTLGEVNYILRELVAILRLN
ncbi:MAG: hypothetical protein WAV56_03775 [Microgenomates group bacterium]